VRIRFENIRYIHTVMNCFHECIYTYTHTHTHTYTYIYIYALQLRIIDLTQRGWHNLRLKITIFFIRVSVHSKFSQSPQMAVFFTTYIRVRNSEWSLLVSFSIPGDLCDCISKHNFFHFHKFRKRIGWFFYLIVVSNYRFKVSNEKEWKWIMNR